MKRMQLPMIPHPKPYSLCWVNGKSVLHIHKQVRVPISIDEYNVIVVCDIAPVNAADVLLGRLR